MAKRKRYPPPEPPPIAGAELKWVESPRGAKVGLRPTWTATGAIQHFVSAVGNGKPPAPEVMHWLAECLSAIERDPNSRARPAFGMTARGRPRDDEFVTAVQLFVGLARRQGHKPDPAIDLAAREFHRSPETIRRACRGLATHKPEYSLDDDAMAQILLSWGHKPSSPPKIQKVARPKTPDKK